MEISKNCIELIKEIKQQMLAHPGVAIPTNKLWKTINENMENEKRLNNMPKKEIYRIGKFE